MLGLEIGHLGRDVKQFANELFDVRRERDEQL